jgi:hypothetical protein
MIADGNRCGIIKRQFMKLTVSIHFFREKQMKILAFFKKYMEMLAKTTKKGYHYTKDDGRDRLCCRIF